jgi:hypothetical protein
MSDSTRFHNKTPTGSPANSPAGSPIQNISAQANKPNIAAPSDQNKSATQASGNSHVLSMHVAKKNEAPKEAAPVKDQAQKDQAQAKAAAAAEASKNALSANASKNDSKKADKKADKHNDKKADKKAAPATSSAANTAASTLSAYNKGAKAAEPVKKLATSFKAVAFSAEDQAASGAPTAIVTDTAAAMSQAAAAIHGKFVDMMVAQSDAAFAMWRSTLSAGSVSEAIKAQSSGIRQAYETGSAQMKDLAGVTEKAVSEALEPVRGYWGGLLPR